MSHVETYTVDHNHSAILGSSNLRDQYLADPTGLLWMWEPPKPQATYVIAADPSRGIPGWNRHYRSSQDRKTDNAALQVLRLGTNGKRDAQVAEYAAPIDPYDLASLINLVGRMYGGSEEEGQALVIIEVWPGPGLATQRELWEKYGYTNMFVWKYLDKIGLTSTNSYGWTSSPKSKRDLWIKSLRHIQLDGVDINSPWLIEEMANCQMDMDKGYGEAVSSWKDDRVDSFFMGLWALHDWTGQVSSVETSSDIDTPQPDWQASDMSYEDMMERWEDMMEDLTA